MPPRSSLIYRHSIVRQAARTVSGVPSDTNKLRPYLARQPRANLMSRGQRRHEHTSAFTRAGRSIGAGWWRLMATSLTHPVTVGSAWLGPVGGQHTTHAFLLRNEKPRFSPMSARPPGHRKRQRQPQLLKRKGKGQKMVSDVRAWAIDSIYGCLLGAEAAGCRGDWTDDRAGWPANRW